MSVPRDVQAVSGPVLVVIPCLNEESHIEDVVTKLAAEADRVDLRIAVADGGSTDQTRSIVQRLMRSNPRLVLMDNAKRIQAAGGARHIDVHGNSTGHVAFGSREGSIDPYSIPAKEPYLLHPFLMLRRSILERAGNYRYVYNAEDTDLYWRLRELGQVDVDNKVLGSYRMHDQSISGGSILNGRIMAMSCQLAALSARRRKSNRPDIAFRKEAIDEYRKARSLQGICEAAQRDLDVQEAAYLRIATCAKLLEMEAYRPYDLEIDDARFIHDTYAPNELFSSEQLAEFRYLISTAAARLLKNGALREAITLTPRPLAVGVCLRFLALHLPQSLYHAGVRLRRKISKVPLATTRQSQ